jgi:type IV secretory pathway TraG/TraD family ATPase VirD4
MSFTMMLALAANIAILYVLYRYLWVPAREWCASKGIKLTAFRLVLVVVILGGLATVIGVDAGPAAIGSIAFMLIPLGVWFWLFRSRGNAREGHHRGGMVVSARELEKLAQREDPHAEIFVGGVGVPRNTENRHCLLAGATGSGKSQAFYQILEVARARGDAAVVADVNAEMLSRFFDPSRGDVILNPLDKRSENWSPLAEISGPWDADRIAKSIIPDGEGGSAEWNHYAQVLLSAVLAKVWAEGGKNFELTTLLLSAPSEDLGIALEGTPAAQLFAPGAERMLSSIRAITATYCQSLSYLNPSVGRDGFSITKFIQTEAREKRGAWMFFPVRDDFFKSFKSLVAGQIDIAISALLSAPDDESRRVWYSLDEFATWGRINSITDLLTKARKKGGCAALGLQSISQIREAYGQHGAQTLLSCLGNWLTLRSGDSETGEYMSRSIGDEQIRRINFSENHEGEESSSEQVSVERSVMPAELQNLPDLVGILNIAGPLPAGWVTIPVSNLPRKTPGFEMVEL